MGRKTTREIARKAEEKATTTRQLARDRAGRKATLARKIQRRWATIAELAHRVADLEERPRRLNGDH